MAFKMAKGSLFAILLRSNWWYSVLIGLVLFITTFSITQGQYLFVSLLGATPFFGIGGYTAYKQFQLPSKKRVLEIYEQIQKMPPGQITEKIVANYVKHGYDAVVYKGNGAEVELTRGHRVLMLSSKRFKAATTGIQPLKLLVASGEESDAIGYLYVTIGEVSNAAAAYAKENNIELIDLNKLTAFFDGKAKID